MRTSPGTSIGIGLEVRWVWFPDGLATLPARGRTGLRRSQPELADLRDEEREIGAWGNN